MKKINQKLYSALAFILASSPGLALAQEVNIEGEEDVRRILENIFDFFYSIFFGIALLALLYAAYLYTSAVDDPEKLKKAKKVLIYTMVGIALAFLALGVPDFIRDLLSGGS